MFPPYAAHVDHSVRNCVAWRPEEGTRTCGIAPAGFAAPIAQDAQTWGRVFAAWSRNWSDQASASGSAMPATPRPVTAKSPPAAASGAVSRWLREIEVT